MNFKEHKRVDFFILTILLVAIIIISCEQNSPTDTEGGSSTPTAPTVSTASVSETTLNSATISGTVNPNEDSTSAWFDYNTSKKFAI